MKLSCGEQHLKLPQWLFAARLLCLGSSWGHHLNKKHCKAITFVNAAVRMQMKTSCEEQRLEVPQWLADAASSHKLARLAFQQEDNPEPGVN